MRTEGLEGSSESPYGRFESTTWILWYEVWEGSEVEEPPGFRGKGRAGELREVLGTSLGEGVGEDAKTWDVVPLSVSPLLEVGCVGFEPDREQVWNDASTFGAMHQRPARPSVAAPLPLDQLPTVWRF